MSLTPVDGIIIALILLAIPALMLGVRGLGQRFGWDPEVSRKLVHVATGTLALTFPLLFSNPLPVLILIGVAIPLMFAIRLGALRGVGNAIHGVQRQSYGEVYLALAIAIIFLRAEAQPVLYVLPILVITLSDTAAALVGTAYGRRRFPVEGGAKSMEGVAVFFVITWLAGLIVLVLMSGAAPLNMVLISMLLAAFCALVEVDSWRGLDNLFVPIGAYLLLSRYLESGTGELAISTAVFLLFLGAVLVVARLARLPAQAARAYAVLLFLMFSIVSLHNIVLPSLAILAHLAARTIRPCRSKRADFDLLFVAAMCSLFWMVLGDASGRSVISLFNLTFAGAGLGFLALTLTGYWRLLALPAMVAAGALVLWVADANLPWSRWYMPDAYEVALALAIPLALPLWRPAWFDRQRSLRIFALAMIVPIVLCLRGFFLL